MTTHGNRGARPHHEWLTTTTRGVGERRGIGIDRYRCRQRLDLADSDSPPLYDGAEDIEAESIDVSGYDFYLHAHRRRDDRARSGRAGERPDRDAVVAVVRYPRRLPVRCGHYPHRVGELARAGADTAEAAGRRSA